MVLPCRTAAIFISGSASVAHLVIMLIHCTFAHPLVPSTAQDLSPRPFSLVKNEESVGKALSVGQRVPMSRHDFSGARGLRLHEETVDVAMQNLAPSSSERPFEGVLAADGSISSVKLMLEEGDESADSGMVNQRRRRPGQGWQNRNAGKQQNPDALRAEKKYPPCAEELRDLIPCLNAAEGHLYGRCPKVNGGSAGRCVIPAPKFYSRQFKWPASKNQVRGPNVPNVPLLQQHRAASWLRAQGSANTIFVGDGDPRFPNGTSQYVRDLATELEGQKFGTDIRLALDVGCGAGSVAAALGSQGVLTLSIAGEDSADNGVQLVMERGYPALVQELGTQRLPYPSEAFDLIHCDVQWEAKSGLKLLEINRILRAGGFFIWKDQSEAGDYWQGKDELIKGMCWIELAKRGGKFAIWQKPTNQTCYMKRYLTTPPLCNTSVSPDKFWNAPVQSCLVGFPGEGNATTQAWPGRLQAPPFRLEQTPCAGMEAAKREAFMADLNYWVYILAFYVVDFGPVRASEIHNVLDMNAGYGGFAAAVAMQSPPLQWWVLNVVPIDQPDRLGVVFDRGLLGVYHDWCESLDIYPRSFDMIHSSGLFSSTLRCEVRNMLQEMDRLLRPGGFAIIRDQKDVLLLIQTIATAMHWKATLKHTESGPLGKDKVLNCQKTFWQPR